MTLLVDTRVQDCQRQRDVFTTLLKVIVIRSLCQKFMQKATRGALTIDSHLDNFAYTSPRSAPLRPLLHHNCSAARPTLAAQPSQIGHSRQSLIVMVDKRFLLRCITQQYNPRTLIHCIHLKNGQHVQMIQFIDGL